MNRKTLVETAVVASWLSAASVASAPQTTHKDHAEAAFSHDGRGRDAEASSALPTAPWQSADIEDQVNRLIARYGRHPSAAIAPKRHLHDLGVDILALVDIVIHVERGLGVELDPNEILSWLTPADIVESVQGALRT